MQCVDWQARGGRVSRPKMAARQTWRIDLFWGRLGWCLLPVLTHCGGRSTLSFQDEARGGDAGASSGGRAGRAGTSGASGRPGSGGGVGRGGSGATAGTGGAISPGTGGFGTAGTGLAGFGALGGSGGSAGVAGAGATCPLPCENNRECARAAGRAFCDCGPGLFGDQCEVRTESIAIGTNHACLLRSDGQVACWGRGRFGESMSPGGSFASIDAHGARNCGIVSGRPYCWGEPLEPAPQQAFSAIAVGASTVCGVTDSERVQCFVPGGAYVPDVANVKQLVAGDDFACVLHATGGVSCWGENAAVVQGVPSGEFHLLTAGSTFACGLTPENSLQCWGDPAQPAAMAPSVEAIAVAAGRAHACAVRGDYSLVCWGDNTRGQSSPPPEGQFVSVFAGGNSSCAIDADGRVHCWGGDENVGPAPGGHFIAVSAATDYACALGIDGSVSCFGSHSSAAVSPPRGHFSSISAGRKACGVQRSGKLDCWGAEPEEPGPPDGRFLAVSTNDHDSCAIRESGELACWGQNQIGLPPPGTFSHVSVGPAHACAITRDDHQGVCWGIENAPGVEERLGYATAIASGDWHACALDQKSHVTCWGMIVAGPATQLRELSAGTALATGVTTTGELVSWGNDSAIQPLPAGADFTAITSYSGFACALRTNGTLSCWGALTR